MDLQLNFDTINCCACEAVFAIPHVTYLRLKNSHDNFYCVYCGTVQHFTGESDAERYKRKAKELQTRYEEKLTCCINLQDEVEHKNRQINGYKGALAKTKKAVSNQSN